MTAPAFDFANLLLAGPCNARCPFCIGKQIDPRLCPPNLGEFPPRGLEALIERMRVERIPQLVISGANTDPQLYRYEAGLLERLRCDLPAGVQIGLHTNGRQALRRMQVFNRYDRACISFPSFEPQTYRRVMGVGPPPDLAQILMNSAIPVKVSCVLTSHNLPALPEFLCRLHILGVRRVVLRKLYGERWKWQAQLPAEVLERMLLPTGDFHGSPVYDLDGMQVTLWDFETSACRSLNLFSSGVIGDDYLLAKGSGVRTTAAFVA